MNQRVEAKHGDLAIVTREDGQWAAKIRTVNQVIKGANTAVLVADAGKWVLSLEELKREGSRIWVTHRI